MPKRVIDGEALWKSNKLNQISPSKYRGELANLLPLMCAEGSFEADPRLVWATVYSYNRPDVTLKQVDAMLREFERVKILVRWQAEDGKLWGTFVGVDKPGRLPPPSARYKEAVSITVPEGLVAAFLANEVGSPYLAPKPSLSAAYHGTGQGIGSGLRSGIKVNDIGNGYSDNTLSTEPITDNNQTLFTREDKTEDRKNSNKKSDNTHQPEQNEDTTKEVRELIQFFRELVNENPHLRFIPDNYEELWGIDFKKLREDYSYEKCCKIIKVSQLRKWQKYVVRPLPILQHAEEMAEQADIMSDCLDELDAKRAASKHSDKEEEYGADVGAFEDSMEDGMDELYA